MTNKKTKFPKTGDDALSRAEFLRVRREAPPVELPIIPPERAWQSLEQRRGEELPKSGEFAEALPEGPVREMSRRGFLQIAGASVAVGAAIGCGGSTGRFALPLLNAQPEQTPGVNLWYATVCGGCAAGCGALAKSRDGRPIKLEGNPDHPMSRGALCATGQAQTRALYDSGRLQHPEINGAASDWAALDADLAGRFAKIRTAGGAVRVLTPTINSPSLRRALDKFLAGFKDAQATAYDALSAAAIPAAYARTHGARITPRPLIAKADLLVGIGADFLGNWLSPVEFTKAWAQRRDPTDGGKRMSRLVQIEAGMSLTGANADERIRVAPSDLAAAAEFLCAGVEKRAGIAAASPFVPLPATVRVRLDALASELWDKRGAALVLCGLNDLQAQIFTARINKALGAEGTTLDLAHPLRAAEGDDGAVAALAAEMAEGKVAALFVLGVNPVYDLPPALGFAAAFARVPLRVAIGLQRDETAALSTHLAPDSHFLESWRDVEAVTGTVGLGQPLINPLFKVRDRAESLLAWSGAPQNAHDWLRDCWAAELLPKQKTHATLDALWAAALQNGFIQYEPAALAPVYNEARAVSDGEWRARKPAGAEGLQLLLIVETGAGDGRFAANPWLRELPDPVTKITWDQVAQLSPATAMSMGISTGDMLRIAVEGEEAVTLPVFVQPGLHDRTVALAVGHGRAGQTGFNAFAWRQPLDGLFATAGRRVAAARAGKGPALASTQTHHSLESRDEIARTIALPLFVKNPEAASKEADEFGPSLYAAHPHPNHRWGLAIDLSRCTGCSACVVGCMAENNIPTVGRDEVARSREMHWLRIDRYYTGDESDPGVIHQPMMCQQCDNAPCENVCPVLATVHSEEGLNEQIYNRCVGTRYCANNCPYKVRRFNWWTYAQPDPVERLGLNPDVTVRSRGVMEKCTFCVQRIAETRITAKNEGRPLADREIKTACEQSCPGDAMVFGDLNDPKSTLSVMMKDPRRYAVLGELGVAPGVGYLAKVRNVPGGTSEEEPGHGV